MLRDSLYRYLAIGTGLDPRQQVLYGRQLGPLLVGLSLGLVSCSTTGIAPGYTGASMNPTRALALAIAGRNWHRKYFLMCVYHRKEADRDIYRNTDHWVWWVGPVRAKFPSSSRPVQSGPQSPVRDTDAEPSLGSRFHLDWYDVPFCSPVLCREPEGQTEGTGRVVRAARSTHDKCLRQGRPRGDNIDGGAEAKSRGEAEWC
jgi:hypothetical protein